MERTETEKAKIAAKVLSNLSKEALTLYDEGKGKEAFLIVDYLQTADIKSLVLFYDVMEGFLSDA